MEFCLQHRKGGHFRRPAARRPWSLFAELTGLYKFAPDTSPEACAQASAALKSGEFTFSDDEIDAFLPTKLRKSRPSKKTG
jgi:hypothetical protein